MAPGIVRTSTYPVSNPEAPNPSRSIFGRQTFMRSRPIAPPTPSPAPRTRLGSRFRLPIHHRNRAPVTDLEAGIIENSVVTCAYSQPAAGIAAPQPTVPPPPPPPGTRSISRRFTGSESPELQLRASEADDETRVMERRVRNWMGAKDRKRQAGRRKEETEKFMFCFPPIKSPEARKHVLRGFVAGLFTACLLAVYIGLTISHKYSQSEYSVLLIMMMLSSTVVMCHSLTRACLLILRPPKDQASGTLYNVNGYAIPQAPIPVILARDEEAQGIDSAATKLNPPAYGLWRSSIRVDPNAMYWQQNPNASTGDERPGTSVQRPPSYASDDGVGYVVDAVPRSIAPTEDVPLPVHPTERGRVGSPPGEQQ